MGLGHPKCRRLRRTPQRGRPLRRKVSEGRAKTGAEIRALEAEKARLQRVREEETPRARKEAKRRAAEDTAAAMEEAEKKIKRTTPPRRVPRRHPSKGL